MQTLEPETDILYVIRGINGDVKKIAVMVGSKLYTHDDIEILSESLLSDDYYLSEE